MAENEFFSVKSNWKVLGDADLRRVILDKTESNKDICIEDLNPEKCVCLINDDGDVKSKAELEVKANGFITRVILISEAQVIEVFGVNDEYLLTHTSDFFDDWEDMSVYYTRITLPNVPVCKLKFTRARDPGRLWIYGAKLCIAKSGNASSQSPAKFNMDQINRLLGGSRFNNVKEENNFKNFQQFCGRYAPNSNNHNNHLLSCILKGAPSATDKSPDRSGSKLGASVADVGESRAAKEVLSNEAFDANWLASHVDKKLNEVKREILKEIDERLRSVREESNTKLDRIISLLERDAMNA